MFSQNFSKGVQEYFGRRVYLERACEYSRSKYDTVVVKTMDKIPMFIKYIEKERGILIFAQTKKKHNLKKYHYKTNLLLRRRKVNE